jgi:hypothetical protein
MCHTSLALRQVLQKHGATVQLADWLFCCGWRLFVHQSAQVVAVLRNLQQQADPYLAVSVQGL